MAKLSALIDCLSEVLGMPRTAVEAYVKPLRRAGLITSKGKGGPASPDMTENDSAWIIQGILSGSTTKVVEMASIYSNLVFYAYNGNEADLGIMLRMLGFEVNSQSLNHNFFTVVTQILKAYRNPDWERAVIALFAMKKDHSTKFNSEHQENSSVSGKNIIDEISKNYDLNVIIECMRPKFVAKISLEVREKSYPYSIFSKFEMAYMSPVTKSILQREKGMESINPTEEQIKIFAQSIIIEKPDGDLETSISIRSRTLQSVSNLLST